MLERFTERSRQVIVLAQEEARALGHDHLGTEHILLGLLREQEGLGARILGSLDVTVDRVRAQVVQIVGAGEQVTSGQIPFTPRAAKVLELALREVLSLGNSFIGTEHILLGLIDENEGIAARILLGFGVDPEKIRQAVIHAEPEPPAPPSSPAAPQTIYAPPEPLAEPSDVELGWRRRPIALAALGAAVLTRRAFGRSKTGHLKPLEMQVLAYLTLGLRDPTVAEPPGERLYSLLTALACDGDDLDRAIRALAERRLVTSEDLGDDELISITIAGTIAVESWLDQIAPLFGGWPPEHPAADDATG
jgi:Clp amino terminal domain, pathogenicity island component